MTPLKEQYENFEKWKNEQKVLYASNYPYHIYCHLNGNITIENEDEIVWQGIQSFLAIEKFNELTQ